MKNEKGFGAIGLLLILATVAIVGFVGFRVVQSQTKTSNEVKNLDIEADSAKQKSNASCGSEPVIALPVANDRIESILYPGQVRGNNFKPHGGFRLNGNNTAQVTLPLDSKVIDGVRYSEAGEIQYMFDFQTDCGYRIRLDHLHTLSDEMQKIADQLPEPTEDSRTTNISSPLLRAGTVIATKVGFLETANSSFDFGFYDMNMQNKASQQADWPKDFQYTTELATHGTCWFDYLSDENESFVRSLPAGDGTQGKNSEYCS